jgi:ABC-2 type transport system permease protein
LKSINFSKTNPAAHDFRLALKSGAGLFVLGLVIFLVLIPGSAAAVPQTSVFNVDFTHEQLKFRFFDPSAASPVRWAAILAGAGLGMLHCGFFVSKRRGEMLLSTGLRRGALFASRFAAGALALFAMTFVPMTVSLALNYAALGGYAGILPYFFTVCAGLLLHGLVAMTVCMAACAAAGTAAEAVLLGASLLALPKLLFFGLDVLTREFLFGNARGMLTYAFREVAPGYGALLASFDPLAFFARGIADHGGFVREMAVALPPPASLSPLPAWTAVLPVLAAVTLALTRAKKAENTEAAGSAPPAGTVIYAVFPLGVFFALFRAASGFGAPAALVSAFAGAVCCFALLFMLLPGAAGRGPARRLILPAEFAVLLALILTLRGGVFGLFDALPAPEDIAVARMSHVGAPSYLDGAPDGSRTGNGHYFTNLYEYTDAADTEAVLAAHAVIAADGKRPLAPNYADYGKTVVPYDIQISYERKDGGTVTRYYDRISLDALAGLTALDETGAAREAARRTVLGGGGGYSPAAEAYKNGKILIADPFYQSIRRIDLSDERRRELTEALAADISAQGAADRYFPKAAHRAVLLFTFSPESDLERFAYSLSNAPVFLTDGFGRTLALLGAWGALPDSAVPDIEKIILQRYDPYGGMNAPQKPQSPCFTAYRSALSVDFALPRDFGNRPEITAPEEIAALSGLLRNFWFASDGGFMTASKIRGKEEYIYQYLPYADAPDYIKERLGNM